MPKKVAVLGAIGVSLLATSANADVTDNLNLQATITGTCTVNNGADINFGAAILSLSAAVTASTTVDVNCTNTIPYTVGISNGANGNRFLADGGGNFIDYELYSDAGYATRFENIGTSTVGGNGTGAVQTYGIYARIPAQTTPPAGTYTDTVVVSVRY
jgi:spore coat protein U-like protein